MAKRNYNIKQEFIPDIINRFIVNTAVILKLKLSLIKIKAKL